MGFAALYPSYGCRHVGRRRLFAPEFLLTPLYDRTETNSPTSTSPLLARGLAVYLQPRVLIVLLLGFSSGLPLALSGSTLLVWMRESGVDLGTIGLFALVGTPYTLKFLWAPLVDALHVPFFTRAFGRRRGWLVFSQLLLIGAILLLALTDPARSPLFVALGALLVATMSSTQDIVVDAFRVESLPESEQAAGMAVLRRGLPDRHAGLDRGRAVHRLRLRRDRYRAQLGVDVGLCGDGGAGADRHRHRAGRDRARSSHRGRKIIATIYRRAKSHGSGCCSV